MTRAIVGHNELFVTDWVAERAPKPCCPHVSNADEPGIRKQIFVFVSLEPGSRRREQAHLMAPLKDSTCNHILENGQPNNCSQDLDAIEQSNQTIHWPQPS